MKKRILSLLTISFISLFFISCSSQITYKGEFAFIPEKPQTGQEVTLLYKPANPKFSPQDELFAKVYIFDKEVRQASDVKMNYRDGGWTGSFTVSAQGAGILLQFKAGEKNDNNNEKGFLIPLFTKDGQKQAELSAAYADAFVGWGRGYLELNADPNFVNGLYTEAFKADSSLLKKYGRTYVAANQRYLSPDAFEQLRNEIDQKIESGLTNTYEELEALQISYTQKKNIEKADYYYRLIEEKYPKSDLIQSTLLNKVRAAKDAGEKLKLSDNFIERFPGSKYLMDLHNIIINEFRNSKKYSEVLDYAKKYKADIAPYTLAQIPDRMLSDSADLDLAYQITELGIEISKQAAANPAKYCSPYLTPKDFTEEQNYYMSMLLLSKTKILFKRDKSQAASEAANLAFSLSEGKDSGINELYAEILVKLKNYQEAVKLTSRFISEGYGSPRIKELYKESVINTIGSEIAAEDGLAELEAAAKEKMRNKLTGEMINQPSPDFTLTNLKGEIVTLSSLKGKVVVIDFWATWCGPCKSSFPGMQQAVDNFKEDSGVEFLFINTWERVQNKKENAEKFIAEKKYSFNVLMDNDNKVITSYKVRGIPTKFILDKNGNTRFISVGFGGDTNALVEELSMMISLLRN